MAGEEAGVPGDTKLRPKLADVAQQAGVSPATASRVLTGSARVRPETRQQVEAAIAHLGYVRNRAPRAAASRGTGSIAFMVCEDNARVFSEPFFPLMLRSVSRELSARGIQLVLLTAHSPRDYQVASRYLRSGHADGALLVSMHGKRPLDLRSTWAMPGSESCSTVRATRRNLAWATVSAADCAASALTATSWRAIQSAARHTPPGPPAPTGSISRYRPPTTDAARK
jgi:DNA-binding LacI/PurR family transcriptional regulator